MGVAVAVQGRTKHSLSSAPIPPCDPDRQHPARPGARHLRRIAPPERAREQPRERGDARLPPHGRRLPRRARAGDGLRRLGDDRVHHLHAEAGLADDARRRQRRGHRHGVRNDGKERARVRGPRERGQGAHADRPAGDGGGPGAEMGLFDAIDVSGSGLSAERLRMDVTAENLANAQTTRGPNGGPYQRKEVVLQTAQPNGFATQLAAATGSMQGAGGNPAPGGVQAAGIVTDPSAPRQVYDPGHPDANAQGYVLMPNVNPVTEMVDLIASSRSYEANVTALQTAKSLFSKTFDLLR